MTAAVQASGTSQSICYSVFPDVGGKTIHRVESKPWPQLVNWIETQPDRQTKEGCPLLKLASFGPKRTEKGSLRNDANVTAIFGIEGDYDAGEMTPEEAIERLESYGLRASIYTSWSHTPEAPKWRVLAPLAAPVEPPRRLAFAETLNGLLGGALAPESGVLSQSYFVGRRPGAEYRVLHTFDDSTDGLCLDEIDDIEALRSPFRVKDKPAGETPSGTQDDYLAELLAGEDVHLNALRIVGRLVREGLSDAAIRAVFQGLALSVAVSRGQERAEQLVGNELDRMIDGARGKGFERTQAPSEPDDTAWPDPQPITVQVKPEPYPLDALPPTILAAVEEVQAFVKAPIPMVAASAHSALSLATQGHYDVRRAEKLSGPVSLFPLTIAESGERKTTVDGIFTAAIREFQARASEAVKPDLKRFAANMASWKARQEGVLAATRDAARKGKPTAELDAEMEQIELDTPVAPRVPRLLLGDETPESLAWSLAKIWPSSGVISSEAGVVFGAHGMGKDSIMRNLALLNIAWDGGELPIGRKTTESFIMRDVRLTVALQIQEPTLRSFFERSGGLARGMGFFARFLISWPESTQGYRPFSEAPEHWPNLEAFNQRLTAILEQPLPITEDGALKPAMLTLSPEAKRAWVAFTDAVEIELRPGGELYDVKDVASKTADNAVRIAALFHIFEGGIGPIGIDAFTGASRIAAWHLSEARRFFGELVIPPELVDAAKLDAWLIAHCKRHRSSTVGKRHVRQHGPVRDGTRLDIALEELVEMDRVRLAKDGRKTVLSINPALCEAEQ